MSKVRSVDINRAFSDVQGAVVRCQPSIQRRPRCGRAISTERSAMSKVRWCDRDRAVDDVQKCGQRRFYGHSPGGYDHSPRRYAAKDANDLLQQNTWYIVVPHASYLVTTQDAAALRTGTVD